MVASLDDEISRLLAALDRKRMRENTLIVFHSDNGGTRDARVTGEGNVKVVPCDNSPLRGGKGQLYEGRTRVAAIMNWPGHIKPGSEIKEMIHVVDMLPTLVKLAGGSTAQCKPLDGVDIWPTVTDGNRSGRTEIVYNIEPLRGAVRNGDWKLIWRTLLPSKVELFNIADDPNESTDLAEKHPEKVKELKARIEQLAGESAKPLFMDSAMAAVFSGIFGPAPIPTDDDPSTGEP